MSRGLTILSLLGVLFLADGELPAQAPASDTVGGSTAGAPPQEPGSISTTPILPELDRLQSAASDTNAQISRLRIEKWKADPNSRQQAQSNAQSIQRNLTSALPAMITGVRSAPQDLGADFRLYRNLNALFDVMSSLTESAGAFGSKAEYQALARELDTFDSVRRNLGDYLEQLAASTQTQLEQLRTQVRSLQAAAAAAPPKKSVVDDTVPAKKTSTTRKAKPKKPVSPDSGSASTQDSGATNPPH